MALALTVPLRRLFEEISTDIESRKIPLERPPLERPLPFEIGDVVGGCYRLDRVVGAGGMGVVYAGYDTELGRPAAIKVCWSDVDPNLLLREARAIAAFRHPGLIIPFASGLDRGVRYLAMELLRGRTLENHIKSQPDGFLDIERAAAIIAQVADTLIDLHEAGVAHRDLTPTNIMLVPPGRIVLLDFGLADLERFVDDHYMAGSPHYVAPETARRDVQMGQAHLVDIYSLGVIAYRLLLGTLPFTGANVRQILAAQIEQALPDPAQYRPDIPRPLADLIMAMLCKDPVGRPAAEAVAAQLRNMRLRQPTTKARPPTKGLRVLIADDEPVVWDVLSYVLEDRGFELVRANDGRQALDSFRRAPFDIVITDKNMPHMDGIELTQAIKAEHPSTDVIMITAYTSDDNREAARLAGVSRFVAKPFDLDEIGALIDEVANGRRRRTA